jgi:hypothetical protein
MGPSGVLVESTNTYVGYFHTEREAAIAAATSYVRAYGTWAETSDLLLFTRPMEALLSPEEMHATSLASTDTSAAPVQDHQGTGVELLKNGREIHCGVGEIYGDLPRFRICGGSSQGARGHGTRA